MQFKIPFEMPISQKSLRYQEISNEIYLHVLKYISTDDDVSIELMFEELVSHITQSDSSKMYAADKFCLLMDLRSITLGDTIEFKTKTGMLVKLRISDILSNIRTFLHKRTFSKIINTGDISVCIDAPRRFLVNNIDALVSSTINTITDGEQTAVFDDLTEAQKDMVLNSLPADIFNKIITHVNECRSECADVHIMRSNQSLGIEEAPFNLFDTTIFEFLKSIYSGDLMNFYELQYSLTTKLHVAYNHFMSMTPNESRIFINLHSKELKKQESDKVINAQHRFNTQ